MRSFYDWSSKVFENRHFEKRKLGGNKRIMWCKLQEAAFLCLKILQTVGAWVHMKETCLRRYSRYENLQCLCVTCVSAADFIWEYNVRDTSCNLCNVHTYTRKNSLYTYCNLRVRQSLWIYEQTNKQMHLQSQLCFQTTHFIVQKLLQVLPFFREPLSVTGIEIRSEYKVLFMSYFEPVRDYGFVKSSWHTERF